MTLQPWGQEAVCTPNGGLLPGASLHLLDFLPMNPCISGAKLDDPLSSYVCSSQHTCLYFSVSSSVTSQYGRLKLASFSFQANLSLTQFIVGGGGFVWSLFYPSLLPPLPVDGCIASY